MNFGRNIVKAFSIRNMCVVQVYCRSLSLKYVQKLDREGAFYIGSEFQYVGTKTENDLSCKEAHDFVSLICRRPLI